MEWDDVRYFLMLARHGSVRSAGAALGVSHSTVVRRIEALEARLGARLFDRSRDGYTLSETGLAMQPGAERIEAEIEALERDALGADSRLEGPVAVTSYDTYITEMLLEDLRPFCARHPAIELSVHIDPRPYDLTRREADLAIRAVGRDLEPPGQLVGRRLLPIVLVNYVARAHEVAVAPDRGAPGARWLGLDPPEFHARLVAGSSYAGVPTWGLFSSLDAGHAALRAGYGFGKLPTYIGDPDPALRRLDAADPVHAGDVWLLSHPDLRQNARIRAVRNAVTEALLARAPLFAGTAVAR